MKTYEEKYKKALEWMREVYPTLQGAAKEDAEYVFPELKESEDEKIRQLLLRFVKYDMSDNYSDDFTPADCIAWLEKQGEHANFCNKIQIGDKVTRNQDGVLVNLSQLNRVAKKDEKQGEKHIDRKLSNLLNHVICRFINDPNIPYSERDEVSKKIIPYVEQLERQCEQKPADEPKFKVGETIKKEGFNLGFPIVKIEDGFYYNDMGDHFPFTDQDNWKLVEQNSAWSVEDEDILNTIINHFKIDIECTDEDDMVRWLKSLKDRVQPKQEWGEEDETTRKALINLVEMYYGGCIDKTEKNRLLNFLKSLRPQNWTKEDKERYINCLQRLGTGDPKQPETINSKWFKEHVYPQPTWKPSDEQMEMLNEVLNFAANHESSHWNDYIFGILNNLINQLKKLKS